MSKFIKLNLSPKEVDSLLREGYSNLNPNYIVKNVLKVVGISQKDYSRYLKKNPNYISDKLSSSNSKDLSINDIYTLKHCVASLFPKLNFDSLVRDVIITEGLVSLSSATIIRKYETVIKELVESNQFSYQDYKSKLSCSSAWVK